MLMDLAVSCQLSKMRNVYDSNAYNECFRGEKKRKIKIAFIGPGHFLAWIISNSNNNTIRSSNNYVGGALLAFIRLFAFLLAYT